MDEGLDGESNKAGSVQRGPRTITCSGSTCPLPAGPAHLDPAGLRSHLVYPPPALYANPRSRGAPHVGASGGHVSAPPHTQPRCQGRSAPPGHASPPGTMRRGVARPLPGCPVPGRSREGSRSLRQAEGKGTRAARTRGREGAAATRRLRMEGRELLLRPGRGRAGSIRGAGRRPAPGPGAATRQRIRETPPLSASVPGAARGRGLPEI